MKIYIELLLMLNNSQDLLQKLKGGRGVVKSAAAGWVDEIFFYGNIFIVFVILYWGISAFRQARAQQEDDGNFSIVKFATPKVAILIVFVILQILAKQLLT